MFGIGIWAPLVALFCILIAQAFEGFPKIVWMSIGIGIVLFGFIRLAIMLPGPDSPEAISIMEGKPQHILGTPLEQ